MQIILRYHVEVYKRLLTVVYSQNYSPNPPSRS